jgi:penicillin-binding protein 1A
LCIAGGVWLLRLRAALPDVNALAAWRPSQTTEIRSSDGVLLARLFEENRRVVPLSEMPGALRDATIAVEDRRFLEHRGVDWRGAARALVSDVAQGGYREGGSTITQQLVRSVFLDPGKRLSRKAREAMLAVQTERRFTKPEILGMYMNQVYYGERCFGVEAAAHAYFGKPASRLSLAECALLAGIPRRPALYDPYANPEAARQRRDAVLRRMVETGHLDAARAEAAMREPLRLAYRRPPRLQARRAPYFVDFVVRQLEDRYGADRVYRGGLRVQTTLNSRAQAAAELAVRRGMDAAFGRRPTQAALVSLDPRTGAIRAMVGGRDYSRSSFNRAVQAKRQPGSAFKPFVYAAALSAGHLTTDRITDAPVAFDGGRWRPRNMDGRWHGRITLTTALANSINIPAVKLCDDVGPDAVANVARLCGIASPLREDLTLALGTSEVSPLELASAYGVFAASGVRAEPMAIVRVDDCDGGTLETFAPRRADVLNPATSARMDFMLRQVVRAGTGAAAGSVPGARGKTGTTDSRHDAWFVGYTPALTTAVWVGNDHPSPIPGLTGGGVCAPIWAAFMGHAIRILPRGEQARPETHKPETRVRIAEIRRPIILAAAAPASQPSANGQASQPERSVVQADSAGRVQMPAWVTVDLCVDSGGLAGPGCPRTVTTRIRPDAMPPPCPLHGAR